MHWWEKQYRIAPYLLYRLLHFVCYFYGISHLFWYLPEPSQWSGIGEMAYVGLENYLNLFKDGDFYLAFPTLSGTWEPA